jgi:DNA repair photolyase
MNAIYAPAGRAAEYSPLACNLFTGCEHRCKYCYCPAIRHQTLDQWAANPQPRPGILTALRKDAARLAGDPRPILFCFMSDPFQSHMAGRLTAAALRICAEHDLTATVLTKNPGRALDLAEEHLRRPGWSLGTTICFMSEQLRAEWEPGAPPICSRTADLAHAHAHRIRTWISIEPVIDPAAALAVIDTCYPFVDYWKVGKLNHFPAIERTIDWRAFLRAATASLDDRAPGRYYIKHDLAAHGKDPHP